MDVKKFRKRMENEFASYFTQKLDSSFQNTFLIEFLAAVELFIAALTHMVNTPELLNCTECLGNQFSLLHFLQLKHK